ncbi:MAG: CdaR family protein [Kiritimatiellales bacterium]
MTERKKTIKDYIVLLWKTVSYHWLLKLGCVALAFAVWQAIRETTSFEILVTDVPVEISAGPGRAVMDQSAETVNIRFRGAREDLRFISSDELAVFIEVPRTSDRAKQSVKLQPRFVRTTSRAQIVQFDPSEITVSIDREVERILPVKAVFEGELPAGVQLEKTECTPAAVRVRGAEQLLRNLELVRTVPVSLDGRYTSFRTAAMIADTAEFWNASPEYVTVDFTLVERVVTRRLENINIRVLVSSAESRVTRISPETATIELSGRTANVDDLHRHDVYLYADCSELTAAGEYEMPVHAAVPAGFKTDRIEPATVKVTVKKL